MPEKEPQKLTEGECEALLGTLFPQGFGGEDVRREITPDGWEKSPLLRTYHPSLEQVYQETIRLHQNLQSLRRSKQQEVTDPEPTREEVATDYQEAAVETEREVRELVGKCLWDIFSDNHDVIAPDGRIADFGSFRGAAGFIADVLSRQTDGSSYDYMDIYMGTIWINQRADLTPVYEMIFRRLKAHGYDWVYHFPQLGAVDLHPMRQALKESDQKKEFETEWQAYSPSETIGKEEEQQQEDAELEKLRADLDKINRESMQAALDEPPPCTVLAYEQVYGDPPRGWPPGEEE